MEDGHQTQSGTPDEIRAAPRSAYAADLVGVNLFAGVLTPLADGAATLHTDLGEITVAPNAPVSAGTHAIASLRPIDISLHAGEPEGSARNRFRGTIGEIAVDGERARVRVASRPPLTAEITAGSVTRMGLSVGSDVWASFKAVEVSLQVEGDDDAASRSRYPERVKTTERESLEAPEPEAAPTPHKHKNPILQFLGELPGLIIMAFVLALLIKTFLVQAFFIPSGSMEPTLRPGDRVLVLKVPYYFHDPRQGDIIVFEDPDPSEAAERSVVGGFFHWMFQGLGVQQPDNEDFIKRVIGLPGDVVSAKDGVVIVNGEKLKEPYLTQKTSDFDKQTVPDDQLFVMGDNRANSLDSRFGLGFIPLDKVIGKAELIIWPPGDLGTL